MSNRGSRRARRNLAFLVVCLTMPLACGSRADESAATAEEPVDHAERAGDARIDALAGNWAAELHHDNSTTEFFLHLTPNSTGTLLRAAMSIPALDVHEQALGVVSIAGDAISAGSLRLRHDPEGPRLLGEMPSALVPVYSIALDLRPLEAPPSDDVVSATLEEVEPVWTFPTGGPIWSRAALDAGTIYVGSDDGNVYALDHAGTELWRFASGGRVRADLVTHDGSLLVNSDDGVLYRLDDQGELVWKAELAGTPRRRAQFGDAAYRYENYASAPVVEGGVIYVAHGEILSALDWESGALRWTAAGGDTLSSPALGAGNVFAGSFDGHVYAFHARTGEARWTYNAEQPVAASPTFAGGRVIVGTRAYDLLGLSAHDGTREWSFYNWFSWVESSATVLDAVAYVGSSDLQRVHAVDVNTGREVWRFDTNGSPWARPAVAADSVYVGAVGVPGYFVEHEGAFFALDRSTGAGRWRFSADGTGAGELWGFAAGAALDDSLVIVGGLDGRVYAFRQ